MKHMTTTQQNDNENIKSKKGNKSKKDEKRGIYKYLITV